jgi:hypothetical protein
MNKKQLNKFMLNKFWESLKSKDLIKIDESEYRILEADYYFKILGNHQRDGQYTICYVMNNKEKILRSYVDFWSIGMLLTMHYKYYVILKKIKNYISVEDFSDDIPLSIQRKRKINKI